jgi:transposase
MVTGGRSVGRTVLSLTTLTAIRRNPVIAAFSQRLRTAGRPTKVALTAALSSR